MRPAYNLDKIKYATDRPTFEKAVGLYGGGKVTQFKEGIGSYSAVVLGTQPYRVSIEARRFGLADCECYLGQRDVLCKHLVALSIYAVKNGKPLTKQEKQITDSPICSNKLGILNKQDLSEIKKSITFAMKYIKSYNGSSRLWFSYQNSLSEGCHRLSAILSKLPVSQQTAQLLVDLLLRLDKKLCYGVDDSDGTVGGFMQEIVLMLKQYVKLDKNCLKAFKKLKDRETCFGWEEELVEMIKE